MRKKTEKKQIKKVVDAIATGKSTREAGDIAGVSQTTVMRIKEEKKGEIEVQTRRLMEALPDIVDAIAKDIKTSKTLSDIIAGDTPISEIPDMLLMDKAILTKFMDLSYKMRGDVLRAIGVYPSQSRSVFIENLIAAGGQAIINPKVLHVVGKHLEGLIGSPKGSLIEGEEEEEGEEKQ